ncbi:hypothetical protein EV359DRAFT_87125 [Lentinula novae-zelandiae]|nr:hypothetical protein EV359DRAFT_87125 [Lentinula novae-zelandiae]
MKFSAKPLRRAAKWVRSTSDTLIAKHPTRRSRRTASATSPSSQANLTTFEPSLREMPLDPEPFVVPDGFVNDGVQLSFPPSRDRYLPAIFSVPSHPRIPEDVRSEINRILIIPWPANNPSYNKFFFHYVKENVKIPGGPNATIPLTGWEKLFPGDIIFVRDLSGSGEPLDDIFEGAVVSPDPDSNLGKMMLNLRNLTLGTREERTQLGRTHFEKCSKRAIPVGGEGSCYSVGLSHQKPRNLAGPSAGGKVRGKISEEEQEHVEIRENLVKTAIRIGVDIFKRLLPQEYKVLENNAELHNVPRIGTDDNVCFTGVQYNVAKPQPEEDKPTCIETLFFFGGVHIDQADSNGGRTKILSAPDLPEGWEGGRFHLVEFGLYVELDGLIIANFSGLRLHGGTPPLAPTGAEIPAWAYRSVVVLYPQGPILDGQVVMNISADEDGVPMQLTPKMRNLTSQPPIAEIEYEELLPEDKDQNLAIEEITLSARKINFVDDGHIIMTPQAEADFLARAFYEFLRYHQIRSGMTAPGDFETFRHTWSIKRNDCIYYPRPWPLCPDGSGWSESLTSTAVVDNIDDEGNNDDKEFSVRRFISHRLSNNPKYPGYEYLIEWEQDSSETWVHESLISQGQMYNNYHQKAFTKITEVSSESNSMDFDGMDNFDHSSNVAYQPPRENEVFARSSSPSQNNNTTFRIPLLMEVSEDSIISTIQTLEDAVSSRHEAEGAGVLKLFQQIQEIHLAIENTPLDPKTMKVVGNA